MSAAVSTWFNPPARSELLWKLSGQFWHALNQVYIWSFQVFKLQFYIAWNLHRLNSPKCENAYEGDLIYLNWIWCKIQPLWESRVKGFSGCKHEDENDKQSNVTTNDMSWDWKKRDSNDNNKSDFNSFWMLAFKFASLLVYLQLFNCFQSR